MINPFFKLKTVFWPALAISFLFSSPLFCMNFIQEMPSCHYKPLLEIKAGYFNFSDSKMREIYDGGWDFQLCAAYPLWNMTPKWSLDAYGAVEYFRCCGKSINENEKTLLWSVPINLGLKQVFAISCNLESYFALGPRFFYIRQHNSSPYVYENKSKNGFGFFVNTGINYILCHRFVIDIFGEYSNATIHFKGENAIYTRAIQVGGFIFGGGLGYKF